MRTTRRSSPRNHQGRSSSPPKVSSSSLSKMKISPPPSASSSTAAVDENAPNATTTTTRSNRSTRRLTRRSAAAAAAAAAAAVSPHDESLVKEKEETMSDEDDNDDEVVNVEEEGHEDQDDDDEEEEEQKETYTFQDVTYDTYQEMVNAKRRRNQQVLVASGLLDAMPSSTTKNNNKRRRSSSGNSSTNAAAKGLTSNKKRATTSNEPRRVSKRLAGIASDGKYVDEERAGRFSIASSGDNTATATISTTTLDTTTTKKYGRRINDGSDLSLQQAVELIGPKWLKDDSVLHAQSLVCDTLLPLSTTAAQRRTTTQAKEEEESDNGEGRSSWTHQMMQQQRDDVEVAKVVPDRIYSITTHPSPNQLVVCAGDKQGHVGIWNVDYSSSSSSSSSSQEVAATFSDKDADNETTTNDSSNKKNHDGIHLFRPHASTTACLEWTRQGTSLLSTSYDGTCRLFDVAAERFQQVFDSSATHPGTDDGDYWNNRDYWFQFAALDHRNHDCFFLSTSVGTAMHVDMRATGRERITFQEKWSEKKINTLSLHPNGYSMLSAGLDKHARLWDLRSLSSDKKRSAKTKTTMGLSAEPVAYYEAGRSINSAFFSPSGKYVLSTTMMDRLDILQDMHAAAPTTTGKKKAKTKGTTSIRVQPVKSIRHNNKTGRWLSTFMAKWHDVHDVFCVGSMQQPRVMEVYFDPLNQDNDNHGRVAIGGESMTAVASRCCFHSRTDQLIVVGGNSSGRVTISR